MTATKPRVLVVDDDEDARQLLGRLLQQAGYDVSLSADAEQALEMLAGQPADVIVSDIHLPRQSGLDLLKRVRERQLNCEVIMLTGVPAVDSAIEALRAGAVDYLTKPVSRDALLDSVARVWARLAQARQRQEALAILEDGLKRLTGQAAPATSTAPAAAAARQYQVGRIRLDLDRFALEVDGQPVEATPTELEILHYLCRNPDRVIAPQELVRTIRGYSVEPSEATEIIRPHISNLRRKLLAASPGGGNVIVTVRGAGYMLKKPAG